MRRLSQKLITFEPIGIVKNEFDETTARTDFQNSVSEIILNPDLAAGLDGLVPGQQIYVIFYLHHSKGYDLRQHPRGDKDRPQRGLFSLRTPRRPNAIGLTKVELLSIHGNQLKVRGLDAINGTPILDLKPA
jgi:tRNA-Thr(GGU) m(6)t(6)A37 methyltransferase TsaA